MINIPVSVGELVDKLTILEIKLKFIKNDHKIKNIEKELIVINSACEPYLSSSKFLDFKDRLRDVNEKLWDVEDKIREKESAQTFDESFITLARAVYKFNDLRFSIKNEINIFYESEIKEEKSY